MVKKRSFFLSLDWIIAQHTVERLDVHLKTSEDLSFLLDKKDEWEIFFLSEEWLSVEEYSFLKTFFAYSWNTDHRENLGKLSLFPPFEGWFLELLCQYTSHPFYRYEKKYVVWKGAISFDPFEAINQTKGAFLLTSTIPLVLENHVIRPIASPFSQEKLSLLFREGKIPLDIEMVDKLLPMSSLLKKHFALSFPEVQEIFDVTVEVELHELQEGFFEVVFWVVIEGERFPLRHDEIHQTILQRKRLLFQKKKRVWFLSPMSEGYKKLHTITDITLASFSRFLGEVKQHTIQSHDMKTLFEEYLDRIQPLVTLIPPWKRGRFEEVVFEVVPLGSMDWLEVNFSVSVEGRVLTPEERAHLVRYGYVKRGQGYLSLSSDERGWLSQLEDAWFLRKEEGKVRLHPSHIFLLKDIVGKAKESWEMKIHLPSSYQDLPFQGEVLDRSIPIPEKVAPFLRPYQKEGYWWLHFLYHYHFGGFLADEMGLGKTLQMIAFLLSIKGNGKSIIVCPSALMHNWAKEITKFAGQEIRFLVMDGSLEKRRQKQKQVEEYDVLITSYSLLHQDREFYHRQVFHLCVLDEAQHVKNKKAKRTQSLKALQAHHRLAITGTPIENTITEMWTIFDFLMPGFLGSHSWFSKTFEIPLQSPVASEREEASRRLKNLVRPFVLRRTKEEVLAELPPKIEQEVWLDLTESQKALYLQTVEVIRLSCEREWRSSSQKGLMHFLAGLTKLRQICLHPALVGFSPEEEPIKMRAVRELVLEALDSGHRVVIFSQFVELLQIVRKELEMMGLELLYLDGRTKNRVDLVDTFNEGEMPVFLISTKAGGTGLTITGADTVILLDPWWNPSVEKQAIDRVHRIGQKKTVHVFRLFTEGTIEEKMFLLQKRKKALFQALVTSNADFLAHLSWEELVEFLQVSPSQFS